MSGAADSNIDGGKYEGMRDWLQAKLQLFEQAVHYIILWKIGVPHKYGRQTLTVCKGVGAAYAAH